MILLEVGNLEQDAIIREFVQRLIGARQLGDERIRIIGARVFGEKRDNISDIIRFYLLYLGNI